MPRPWSASTRSARIAMPPSVYFAPDHASHGGDDRLEAVGLVDGVHALQQRRDALDARRRCRWTASAAASGRVSARSYCMKTRFQNSSKRSQSHCGPHSSGPPPSGRPQPCSGPRS